MADERDTSPDELEEDAPPLEDLPADVPDGDPDPAADPAEPVPAEPEPEEADGA